MKGLRYSPLHVTEFCGEMHGKLKVSLARLVTFNPALPNIPQVISSNLNILRSSQRCLEAFSYPPLMLYRRCKNLRDILVSAKRRSKAPPSPTPPRLQEHSVVTEIGGRCGLSLQREPHLTLFFLRMNEDAYDITSPALLPASFI